MSEKTDGAIIKNGQSRDTGDIRHKTRSEDKQNKKTAQKTKTRTNVNPITKPLVNPGV